MTAWEKILRIVLSVLFVAIVALLGSAFTDTSSSWYQGLTLPALQPPPIAFSIAWGIIYLMFAASLSIVSIHSGANPQLTTATDPGNPTKRPDLFPQNKSTLLLYLASGVLNVLWTYVFFIQQNPAGALLVLILTLIVAAFLIAAAAKVSKLAAGLLIPYFVWLCFALYLNYELAFLN
jgi:tryptophan-rich sensory protein